MKWPVGRSFSGPARRDLLEEIRRTQERLSQLLEDFMSMEEWEVGKVYTPAVDIKEVDNKLVVTTDLPGINKEDVQINFKENMLEIRAKIGKEKEKEEEKYLHQERTYTQFYRAINLPGSIVKEKGSTVKMKNGVLIITLKLQKNKDISSDSSKGANEAAKAAVCLDLDRGHKICGQRLKHIGLDGEPVEPPDLPGEKCKK